MGAATQESEDKGILKEMKDILKDVKNELNFAEAKNMALFTFEGLVLFKIIDLYKDSDILIFKVLYVGFGIMWLIPMCKTIGSFIPNTSKFEDNDNEIDDARKGRILIFYGDISKYKSSKTYLKDIYKQYSNYDLDEPGMKDIDFSKQILMNSKIVSSKYEIFKESIRAIKKITIGFIAISIIINCITFGFDLGKKNNNHEGPNNVKLETKKNTSNK